MEDLGHITLGKDGQKIRILQMTDMHVLPKETKSFPVAGGGSVKLSGRYSTTAHSIMLSALVKTGQPHLVVFTGDIIDGRICGDFPKDAWKELFQEITKPLVELKIPWAYIPGNHDDDGASWGTNELLQVFSLPGCVTPNAKSFNHTYTVGPSSKECLRLWMFDSGRNNEQTKYDPFPLDAVKGYEETSRRLDEKRPGVAYFHIPLPEYKGLPAITGQNKLFAAALHKGLVPSPWKYVPWLVRLLGQHRIVGCSTVNSGAFEAFSKGNNIVATFCGHDHYSDTVCLRGNVFLCYGRVGAFTPPGDWEGDGGRLPFRQGGRILEFDPLAPVKVCLTTWVESKDGEERGSKVVLDVVRHAKKASRRRNFRNSSLTFLLVLLLAALMQAFAQT